MQYLKISKISSRSVHSIVLVFPYQKIFFRFGSFLCICSLDKWMNPFRAVLVIGQSKKRCLNDSFWFVSGFIILQKEHLSFVLARKWTVLLLSPRQLLCSLNKNSRISFWRKLRFQSPSTLPRCAGFGTWVSVSTQKVVTVRRLILSFSLVGQCANTFLNFFDPFLKLFRYPSELMESLFMFSLFSIVFLVKIMAFRSLSHTRLFRMSPDSLNCSIVLNLPLIKQSSKVSWRIRILFASYTCLVKKGMSSRLLSSFDLTKAGFRKIWLFCSFRLLTIARR